jgi:heme/copper-type cytochrome/quinol oxidase subunit 3
MLLGSLSVQWAVSAAKRGEHRQASAAFAITFGFGVAFLNLLSYTASRFHIRLAASAYAGIVGTLALAVGIIVGLAMALVAITLFRVRGEQVAANEPDQARAAAWFWHYATLAALVAWFAVFVRK